MVKGREMTLSLLWSLPALPANNTTVYILLAHFKITAASNLFTFHQQNLFISSY